MYFNTWRAIISRLKGNPAPDGSVFLKHFIFLLNFIIIFPFIILRQLNKKWWHELHMTNKITITYCTQCRWLLRTAWMAQELLTTFDGEIAALTLIPGTGGIFEVTANDQTVWSRKAEGCFPEITELKQRVRDVIAPDRDLGHSDKKLI